MRSGWTPRLNQTATCCVTLRGSMTVLELTRTPGDRRLYALEGVGSLRLEGFASRAATVTSGGSSWRIARSGFWRRVIEATDDSLGRRQVRAAQHPSRWRAHLGRSRARAQAFSELSRALRTGRRRAGARASGRQRLGEATSQGQHRRLRIRGAGTASLRSFRRPWPCRGCWERRGRGGNRGDLDHARARRAADVPGKLERDVLPRSSPMQEVHM
jgi:hypothetical protein